MPLTIPVKEQVERMHNHLDCPKGATKHPASTIRDQRPKTLCGKLSACLHLKQIDEGMATLREEVTTLPE